MLNVEGTLVGWIGGRWQPWCKHHETVVEHARDVLAKKQGVPLNLAYLGIGVRVAPYSSWNPFGYETRAEWIKESSNFYLPFREDRVVFGMKQEVVDAVGDAPMFTREKAWYLLGKLGGFDCHYEERDGQAAGNIRQMMEDKDIDGIRQYVPEHVAKDIERMLESEEDLPALLSEKGDGLLNNRNIVRATTYACMMVNSLFLSYVERR